MANVEDMRIQVSEFDQLAELMRVNMAKQKPVAELGTQAVKTEPTKDESKSND